MKGKRNFFIIDFEKHKLERVFLFYLTFSQLYAIMHIEHQNTKS